MQPSGLERVAQLLDDMGGGLLHENEHELDPIATATGNKAGQVKALLWVQKILQEALAGVGKYEDPRPLENVLGQVQDELRAVQDGSPVAVD